MNETEFAELYCTIAHNNCDGHTSKAFGFWSQQNPHDLWALIKEASKLQPKHILEIGVNHGGTTVFLDHLAGPEGKVVGVDKCGYQGDIFSMFRPEYCDYTPVSNLKLIAGDSHDLPVFDEINEFFGGRIDFLFIDGDHTYEGTKLDYEMYGPLVPEGGIIGVDDLQDDRILRFWEELDVPRSVTSPRDTRLGVIKK